MRLCLMHLIKLDFSSDFVSVFQSSPLHSKACRAKYPMLGRIESKIFLLLLFSNAYRSDSKSTISPITVFEILRLVMYGLSGAFTKT